MGPNLDVAGLLRLDTAMLGGPGFGRNLALLGGTTTASDCLAALAALYSRKLLRGPETEAYERAFADATRAEHGIAFGSGRLGLYAILTALGVGPGDEVALQVPTHIVVANAVRYAGATPVYLDCELATYNVDLEKAGARVTPRTRALILQHTFGIPAPVEAAMRFCREHDLILIEDCVHALGASYRGSPVGAFGKASFFSTEETKVISTTMGGMVVTDDAQLARSLRALQTTCADPPRALAAGFLVKLVAYHCLMQPRVHRFTRPLYDFLATIRGPGRGAPLLPTPTSRSECLGAKPTRYEQTLSNGQAVLGLRQLRRLEANVRHRGRIARIYSEELGEMDGRLRVASPSMDVEPSWVRYPVWVPDRERATRLIKPHAVAGRWFSSVLEEAESPSAGAYTEGSCPCAERAAVHLINLPTHPRVTETDARRIAVTLRDAC